MDDLRVRQAFDQRAALHGNLNAVLDATPGDAPEHANLWRDYVTRRVALRHVRPSLDDVLLDVGCGVGRLSFQFSPLVRRVVGIDVSEQMIKVARGQLEGGRWANVSFHCAEADAWPVSDGTMTKALCFCTLQHVSDDSLPALLTRLRRTLVPGGRVLCFEQVRERAREEAEIHLQRTVGAYCRFFADAGLRLRNQRPVLRYPSYALALWNRFPKLPRAVFPLLSIVEQLTLNRRPELADYYTCFFDLERGD